VHFYAKKRNQHRPHALPDVEAAPSSPAWDRPYPASISSDSRCPPLCTLPPHRDASVGEAANAKDIGHGWPAVGQKVSRAAVAHAARQVGAGGWHGRRVVRLSRAACVRPSGREMPVGRNGPRRHVGEGRLPVGRRGGDTLIATARGRDRREEDDPREEQHPRRRGTRQGCEKRAAAAANVRRGAMAQQTTWHNPNRVAGGPTGSSPRAKEGASRCAGRETTTIVKAHDGKARGSFLGQNRHVCKGWGDGLTGFPRGCPARFCHGGAVVYSSVGLPLTATEHNETMLTKHKNAAVTYRCREGRSHLTEYGLVHAGGGSVKVESVLRTAIIEPGVPAAHRVTGTPEAPSRLHFRR